jgi:transglutaminase-like putative cysteine protease
MRYHRTAKYDPAAEFAFASPYVPRDDAFADYARSSFAPGRPLLDAARALMHRIHADFEYETTATDVNTPALDALALRKGVCQDLAHVMLGCLRSLGLPARYVSGYLLTEPAPGQPRLVGTDASHAWVGLYLPTPQGRGSWVDLDPTNERLAGEDYVTLAIGRDYSDVSPMRGVIHGGANHSMRVAVTVAPAEQAAARAKSRRTRDE